MIGNNADSAAELAELCGFRSATDMTSLQPQLLINATPIGMTGSPDAEKLAFSVSQIQAAEIVFDVVALPETTPLINCARELNKTVITGSEVFAIQAVEQFALYTGIRPSNQLFREAAAYSRQ